MATYNFLYNDNMLSYLQSGGFETKSRILKLLPSGDVDKMEQELERYIFLLRKLFEISSLQESRHMMMYVFAQVSAVAVTNGVDDWEARKIQKDFYIKIGEDISVDKMLMLCHDFIISFTQSVFAAMKESHCSSLVQDICKYLYFYMDENITLERVANHFHFSQSYITHKFKKEMGMSIGSYVVELRVKEAKSLLAQNVPAGEISTQLGFSSQSHFNKCFRAKTGMSPGEWKQRNNRTWDK